MQVTVEQTGPDEFTIVEISGGVKVMNASTGEKRYVGDTVTEKQADWFQEIAGCNVVTKLKSSPGPPSHG